MKKTAIAALLSLALLAGFPASAWAQELAVGGQIVGIQLRTRGVMVAGVSAVPTEEGRLSPAAEAGVKAGDFIVELNGAPVESANGLIGAVGALEGAAAELTLLRDGKERQVTVQPALSQENQWMLGMWLRDAITGIGTVTFCDPATGRFGALGHSVRDEESGLVLPLSGGTITEAEIVDVIPGTAGAPGELSGCTDAGRVLGRVEQNTEHGIFGRATASLGGRLVETGELESGPATILSTVSGHETREYQAQIGRLYREGGTRHAVITITDPELRAQTGGIVQGMSGSPILQNGKLVGAVTHVFVSDPSRGYAISIQDMLDDAQIEDMAA